MISTTQVLNEASGKKNVAFKIKQTECILYIFSRLNRLVLPCSFFDVCYQQTQCIHVRTYQAVAAPLEDILRSTVIFGVKAPAALALNTKQLVDAYSTGIIIIVMSLKWSGNSKGSCLYDGRLKVFYGFFVLGLNSSSDFLFATGRNHQPGWIRRGAALGAQQLSPHRSSVYLMNPLLYSLVGQMIIFCLQGF